MCYIVGIPINPLGSSCFNSLYTNIMTPDWLYKHSTITKPFFVYPKYLEILSGKNFECLVQAELIALRF